MDFVSGLPRGKKGSVAIWIIINWFIKSTLFLPMKMTDSINKLAKLYMDKMVRLHRVPISIVFYKDLRSLHDYD